MARRLRGGLLATPFLSMAAALALALAGACSSSSERSSPPKSTPPAVAPSAPGTVDLTPQRFPDLPGWNSDRHVEALEALRRSCPKFMTRSPSQTVDARSQFGRVGQWQELCAAANLVVDDDRAARAFFERWFVPYGVTYAGDPRGLFTGYYEPVLRGSWRRTARHTVPVYRTPPEATPAAAKAGRGGPLPSRNQIEAGALSGRGLELLWLDDPVDAFFLHIQGSGQVEMTDGSRIRIGYAGKNGHAYTPIGAELIRLGEIPREQMSMQAIRAWLKSHPAQAPSLMGSNASYVFFRIVEGEGPIGAQGVPLRAGRSIAVDPAYVPYGIPVWLDTSDPRTGGGTLRRLVVAQDTGGAIKGPIRGDLFWGSGDEAGEGAGLMKQEGRWFVLLPRAAAATS